jgi:hypothetical protein
MAMADGRAEFSPHIPQELPRLPAVFPYLFL